MRAKEFFMSVWDAERKCKGLARKRKQYEEMARGMTGMTGMSQTSIRSTDRQSRTETAALRLIGVEEALGEEFERYVDLVEQAEALIKQIHNTRYQEVLSYRYLCGMNWHTVCAEMGYKNVKYVYRIHGGALAAAQRAMDAADFG